MKALYDRFKELTGAKYVDLAAQEGLTKQRIHQLMAGKKRTTRSRIGIAMLEYIDAHAKRETAAYYKRMDKLSQLSSDIRGHVYGKEDQTDTNR